MSKVKKPTSKKMGGLKTLLIIALICIAIYWVFFASLSFLTRHGQVVEVPNYIGQDYSVVLKDIERKVFRLEVDSSYHPDIAGHEVLDQQPRAGHEVKKGRTLFLTINRSTAPEIEMPNLVNLSLRSAEMVLNSNKLKLGKTTTKPDLANGAVIEMTYKGKQIRQYDKIKQGETIDLVIGGGLDKMEFEVPDLVGFSYDEVISLLSSYLLHPNISYDGVIVDTFGAVVVAQNPKPINSEGEPNMIRENQVIHIRMKDPSAGDHHFESQEDQNIRRSTSPRMEQQRTESSEAKKRQPKYQYSNN